MANTKKTYFLCPSFDLSPPPNGPISLGSILTDPFSIDRPLHSTPPPPQTVFTTTKSDWKSTLSKTDSTFIGLFAKFVQLIVGIGVEANAESENSNLTDIDIDDLESTFYNPLEVGDYLEKSLQAPNVKRFIEKSKARKPLYIVTGLKIAHCGRIRTREVKSGGVALGMSLDGTVMSAPIEVGPKFENSVEKRERTSWVADGDFIFAYRLSKIGLRKKSGEVKEQEYIKGALFEVQAGAREKGSIYEIDNVSGDSFAIGEFGDDLVNTMDEDEGCNCVVPSRG